MAETPRNSPYLGLTPFGEADAPFFFGRDKDTRLIVANIFAYPITLFYGASGVGKSSVLRARVLPELRKREQILAVEFKDWQTDPGKGLNDAIAFAARAKDSEFLISDTSRSLKEGVENLAFLNHPTSLLMVILDQFEEYFTYAEKSKRECFQSILRKLLPSLVADCTGGAKNARPADLAAMLTNVLESGKYSKPQNETDELGSLFAEWDQIEKHPAVIQCKQEREKMGDGWMKFREDFYDLANKPTLVNKPALLNRPRLVNQPTLPVNFLISIREDSLAKLDSFRDRVPVLFDNCFRLEHLTRKEARQAIEEPIKVYNQSIASKSHTSEIEEGLTTEVLDEVTVGKIVPDGHQRTTTRKPEGRVEAPYLQLVMQRIWEEEAIISSHVLRKETLRKLGGAAGIINDHLDQAMRGLAAKERTIAARALPFLVGSTGAKIALSAQEVVDRGAPIRLGKLEPVLEKLTGTKARILNRVAARQGEQPRFELFHDLLAEPILAWRRRFEKWVLIRRFVEALALTVVFLCLAGYVLWEKRIAALREKEARAARLALQAESARKEDPKQLSLSALLAIESLSTVPTSEAANTLRRAISLLPRRISQMTHGSNALDVAFSPDGRNIVTASLDNTAQVWNSITGARLGQPARHEAGVKSVAFSPDGQIFATGSEDKTARFWATGTGQQIGRTMTHHDTVSQIAFSPEGQYFATVSFDTVQIWSTSSQTLVGTPAVEAGEVITAFVFLQRDGSRYVIATRKGAIAIRETVSGKLLAATNHGGTVNSISVSADGKLLATAGTDSAAQRGSVRLWQTGDLPRLREIRPMSFDSEVTCISISHDDKSLAVGEQNGLVGVWELKAGNNYFRGDHGHAVRAVRFSQDDRYLATASDDCTARVWDVQKSGQEMARVVHAQRVEAVAFSPDTKNLRLATASDDGTAGTWETVGYSSAVRVELSEPVKNIIIDPEYQFFVTADVGSVRAWKTNGEEITRAFFSKSTSPIAISFDGKRLASATKTGTINVLYFADGKHVRDFNRDEVGMDRIVCLSLNRGGSQLAIGGDSLATVLSVEKAGRTPIRLPHSSTVLTIAFSPHQSLLATGCGDHIARVWDVATTNCLLRLTNNGIVDAVAFSPDGRFLATGSADETARIWETSGGRQVAYLRHPNFVLAVAYSPDGKYLATGTQGGTVLVWDCATYLMVSSMNHDGDVESVSFCSDGRCLGTASSDKSACLWLWRPADLIPEAGKRLTRNLTQNEWIQYFGTEPYRKTFSNLP